MRVAITSPKNTSLLDAQTTNDAFDNVDEKSNEPVNKEYSPFFDVTNTETLNKAAANFNKAKGLPSDLFAKWGKPSEMKFFNPSWPLYDYYPKALTRIGPFLSFSHKNTFTPILRPTNFDSIFIPRPIYESSKVFTTNDEISRPICYSSLGILIPISDEIGKSDALPLKMQLKRTLLPPTQKRKCVFFSRERSQLATCFFFLLFLST